LLTKTKTKTAEKTKLEKVAIKITWRNASANWNFLVHRNTSGLILMVPFTFAMWGHLILLAP